MAIEVNRVFATFSDSITTLRFVRPDLAMVQGMGGIGVLRLGQPLSVGPAPLTGGRMHVSRRANAEGFRAFVTPENRSQIHLAGTEHITLPTGLDGVVEYSVVEWEAQHLLATAEVGDSQRFLAYRGDDHGLFLNLELFTKTPAHIASNERFALITGHDHCDATLVDLAEGTTTDFSDQDTQVYLRNSTLILIGLLNEVVLQDLDSGKGRAIRGPDSIEFDWNIDHIACEGWKLVLAERFSHYAEVWDIRLGRLVHTLREEKLIERITIQNHKLFVALENGSVISVGEPAPVIRAVQRQGRSSRGEGPRGTKRARPGQSHTDEDLSLEDS